MRKLKRIIMDFNQNARKTRPQTSYLNKLLDQSLYILDLLPRSAAPILIIFSDSNLYISRLGRYNNILMQFNRVDININFIDIFNSSGNINLYALGLISNKSIMNHISRFTRGSFFTEEKISKITKTKINEKITKLPFEFSSVKNMKISVTEHSNIKQLNIIDTKIVDQNEKQISNHPDEISSESLNSLETIKINDNYNAHTKDQNELITLNFSKCKSCNDNVNIFFCKKPYQDKYFNSNFIINNQALKDLKKTNSQINFSLNFLDLLKRNKEIKIFQKETVKTLFLQLLII